MFVIFWTEEQKYYSDNRNYHWVKEIDTATKFHSKEKATNFAKSGLKDKIHLLEYIEVIEEQKIEIPLLTQEEAEAAYEKLRTAAKAFGEAAEAIPEITRYYAAMLSEQDKLQEDLLHKIEFTSPANFTFIKLGRMLKACRIKRREMKNCLNCLNAIGMATPKTLLKALTSQEAAITNRIYIPRIMPELFK